MKNFFDFTGKKYIVTGASSGIGRAAAIGLSQQGAKVVMVARDENRLEATLCQLHGRGHLSVSLDLAQSDDLSYLLEKAVDDGTRIDGVVHCAGIATILPLSMLDRANMDECMRVNFYSFVELVKQASRKKFRPEKMSIVAVSSMAALCPLKCQTVYAASKAALNAAVHALAVEMAGKKIRINAVCPGVVDTTMLQDSRKMADTEPPPQMLGVTQPEQIAHSIMYLLSDASSCITGRCLFADSGVFI